MTYMNMRLLKNIIFSLMLLGQSCSETDSQFKMILNSPDKFHNQEIEITGVFHEQFEDHAIYLSRTSDKKEALWVDFSEIFTLLNSFSGLDGQIVTITGRFDKNDKGHLGQYQGSLKEAKLIIDE